MSANRTKTNISRPIPNFSIKTKSLPVNKVLILQSPHMAISTAQLNLATSRHPTRQYSIHTSNNPTCPTSPYSLIPPILFPFIESMTSHHTDHQKKELLIIAHIVKKSQGQSFRKN